MKDKILIILLIISIVIGLATSAKVNDLQMENEELRDEMNARFTNVNQRVNELEEEAKKGKSDCSYQMGSIDFENGKVNVTFKATPVSVTDATVVRVDCGFDVITLQNNNGVFSGMAQYPIDNEYYQTYLKVYEGNALVEDEYIDEITAGMSAENMFAAMYDGYAQYGNNRLVLEGDVTFKTGYPEEINSVKLVYGDKEQELGNKTSGVTALSCMLDKEVEKKVYIEMELKDGGKVRLYPDISDESIYYLENRIEGEMINESDKYISFYQEGKVEIITKDGKSYSMVMY